MEDYNSTKDLIVKSGYRIAFYKSILNKIKIATRDITKRIQIEDSKPYLQSYMGCSRKSYIEMLISYGKVFEFCKKRLETQINIINKWIQE